MRFLVTAICVLIALAGTGPDFAQLFRGYEGCFFAKELSTGRTIQYNLPRAEKRFSPCSTFKIPHAAMALDSGVARPDETFRWDGVERRIASWNRDQNLPSAIRDSALWVFEVIEGRLGLRRTQDYLKKLDYGNRDASGFPIAYWLMSSLKISAKEQVGLLTRLVREEWPLSLAAQRQVKSWILVEEGPGFRYFGKTGSGIEGFPGGEPPKGRPEPKRPMQIGWWVGWIERNGQTWVFAANYRGPDAMGHRLRPKLRPAFVELGWLPKAGSFVAP